LDQRVTIKRKVAPRDNMGGEVITWEDDAPIWACAEPIRGREYAALAQAEAETEVRFTIHYRTGITPDSRIVWRETTYELTSPPIDVNAKKMWLELMARTTQNG
jgi:SPP1 family predicted phage head-tail adaptor